MRYAVTTSLEPSPAVGGAARDAAVRWGVPLAPRGHASLEAVARAAGVEALLVLSADRAALWRAGAVSTWDAGMGALRLKRLRCGERSTRDGFLDAASLQPGDEVLDCTLGLAADALVAAEVVGPAGRVVGVEASGVLAALTAEGLRRLRDAAADRITVVHADAERWLARAPDASFDVVAFDPMFREARAEPPTFELVRSLAEARPLTAETLAHATRVARRAVIVKDGAPGWDLARLGLAPLPSARGAKRYFARIERAR